MYRKNARVTVCKTEMQYMDKNKLNQFASFLKPSNDEYLVYINALPRTLIVVAILGLYL